MTDKKEPSLRGAKRRSNLNEEVKRVIGLDLDGTILDHSENKIRLAREYGFELKPEQTVSGQFAKFVPRNVKDEIQNRLYTDPSVNIYTKLMPGALATLRKIKASGQPYYLISKRQTEVIVPILKRFYLWPELFNETNATFVDDMEHKVAPARELGITHYVDDHITTITGLLDFIPHKYLFDPYNVLPDNPAYERIHSWQEIGERLLDEA